MGLALRQCLLRPRRRVLHNSCRHRRRRRRSPAHPNHAIIRVVIMVSISLRTELFQPFPRLPRALLRTIQKRRGGKRRSNVLHLNHGPAVRDRASLQRDSKSPHQTPPGSLFCSAVTVVRRVRPVVPLMQPAASHWPAGKRRSTCGAAAASALYSPPRG